MDIKKFKKPPVILRPTPFWAINDRITPEETARQMADMLGAGMGGGFFHSRHGLITEYMGEEWFSSMQAALDTAKRKGGYLWLYDEDLWPSGNAGGQVAGMKDEYRAAQLKAFLLEPCEPMPLLDGDSAAMHAYILERRKGLLLEKTKTLPMSMVDNLRQYERLVLVREYAVKTPWWSGESYANLLHPQAVREFMRLTHEVYYKRLGDEFGRRIPGIFTDEPCLHRESGIPWYEGIPCRYGECNGRDFWKDLPYIFFDGREARLIRLLIHRTILRQFLEAYSKPIYEWCQSHKIAHTGHYMDEDTFSRQIKSHCGGVMAHYMYQHIPGIDHLCRQIDGDFVPVLLTCKQVSSAARQLGRKRVLTEIFGVSRHTNTFEDFKWLGDYDLVLGANFFCPHVTWYSAKGRRKRDLPPVWNYQQTYWNELPVLNDYFARISYALTCGRPDVKILLLHSIESAIAGIRMGVVSTRSQENIPAKDMKEADEMDLAMRKTLDAILNTGHDCDLGDENFIEKYGKINGNNFVIGRMPYKIVVVPQSRTWRGKTVRLLERFIKNNGILIILGKAPEEIDGLSGKKRWDKIISHKNVYYLPSSTESIQNAISSLDSFPYALTGADGRFFRKTYVQHRIDGKDEIFFIVNSDKENSRDYLLTLRNAGKKKLFRWDAVDGSACLADSKKNGDSLKYLFSLPPAGAVLLTLSSSFSGNALKEKEMPNFNSAKVISLPGPFEFERKDRNVLVLDRISVSYDGNKFEAEEPEWRVRKNIAEHFGTQDALGWQPWVAVRKKTFEGKGGDIILRYRFSSNINKPKSYLIIEDMQKGRVLVNGRQIARDDESRLGWHWDRGFKMVEITGLVKAGLNTADFRVGYDFLTEIEPAYVVGDFGVEMESPYRGRIVKETSKISAGSWVGQGYPFYSGRMVYKSEFEVPGGGSRIFMRIVKPSGVLFNVRVNGTDAGKILWSPYILEITSFVRNSGKNRVELELISSLQNSWGPLHERKGEDTLWVGPNAFENESEIREEFSLFNYGIGGIEILSL